MALPPERCPYAHAGGRAIGVSLHSFALLSSRLCVNCPAVSYGAQPCTNNAGSEAPAATGAIVALDRRHGCGSTSVVCAV